MDALALQELCENVLTLESLLSNERCPDRHLRELELESLYRVIAQMSMEPAVFLRNRSA